MTARRPTSARQTKRSAGTPRVVDFRYPDDPATVYARSVVGGDIVAGPLVRLACERHLRDLREAESKRLVWQVKKVHKVVDFFETLLFLPDVDDEVGDPVPFRLQPFQKFILGSLFGWHRTNGERRFRVAYIETAKGSGKTPMAAGIALYLLGFDGGKGSQIYAAAVTEAQARLVFTDAENMVNASEDLKAMIDQSVNNLSFSPKQSFFRPISAEKRGLDGKRVFGAIIDELHEHQTHTVVDRIRMGTKSRRNALIVEITNAGYDRLSVCWAHHQNSRAVLEGNLTNDTWFAYICCLDEGDRWDVEGPHWLKANPCLPPTPSTPQDGYSLTWDYLREQVAEAKGMPSKEFVVRRLNFCEWTQSNTKHFDMMKWAACGRVIADDELEGVPCWGGLDLGRTDDLSAWALIWQLENVLAVRVRFWVPEAAVEAFPNRPYQEWIQSGVLETTEGDVTDNRVISQAMLEDCKRWHPREVAYDKAFATDLALDLIGDGIHMIETPQGFYLNEAARHLGETVGRGTLAHGGNPILAWMASNTVVRHGRDGLIRLDKDRSPEKIDGIVATVMAISRMIAVKPKKKSKYATSGGYRVTASGVDALVKPTEGEQHDGP